VEGKKLKRIALSVLIVLILSTIVSAVPDSVVTGPYKVSFDIGLKNNSDYLALSADPKESELLSGGKYTAYSMGISSKKGGVTITIKKFEEKFPIVDGPTMNLLLISQMEDNPRISNFASAERTIDGVASAVASFSEKFESGSIEDGYWTWYQPLFDPTHTFVYIKSSLPWDEGTLNLLKTIHVEKIS
jgi:hypothetical protein